MNNSPIFIVGCPRSGTGLLRNLLRSHPRLTFPGESHFIPLLFKAYGDPRNESEARRMAARILDLEWVRSWGLSLDPSAFSQFRSYSEIVSRIYEEWTTKENKQRWGDKTPQYVTEIPTLLELFPESRIIHIIRDGRDVAISWLNVNFGPENVFTAAREWRHFVETGLYCGESVPTQSYIEIRYEGLLANPRETLETICKFIDEPFCDAMLKPNPLESSFREPILGARSPHYASQSEIVTNNPGKWKEKMSISDRVIFESVAGDLLSRLGYETEGTVRDIKGTEKILWKLHNSLWWFLGRLDAGDKTKWMKTDLILRYAEFRRRHLRNYSS